MKTQPDQPQAPHTAPLHCPDLSHACLTKRPQIVSATAPHETNETSNSYELFTAATNVVSFHTQIVSGVSSRPKSERDASSQLPRQTLT